MAGALDNSLGVFKTILLFLQSHKLTKSAETLRNEIETFGSSLADVSPRSAVLRRCKCARNVANQTETERKYDDGFLEGTFEGEPHQLKNEEAHVIYVCDHHHRSVENVYAERSCKSDNKEPASKSEIIKLKSKFSELHREHQKLIAVTSELTSTIQMNIVSQTENINTALEQCKTIYPTLFTNHSDRVDQKTVATSSDSDKNIVSEHQQIKEPIEPLNLEKISPRPDVSAPLTPETVRKVLETVFDRIFALESSRIKSRSVQSAPLCRDEVQQIVNEVLEDVVESPVKIDGSGEGAASTSVPKERVFDIDFAKIKWDLINSDTQRKIKILQALRWRITKSDLMAQEKVMDSFVRNDVLDLYRDVCVPERLLSESADCYVQESACRFINAMASLRRGRDYLTSDSGFLKRVLLRKLKDVRNVNSAVIRNMLVASVQKLSIRKQCRAQIVREGVLEVMVEYLEDFYEELPRYCLEYCTALVMNLCLVDDAKIIATKMAKKVVKLLKKFLEGDKVYCLPYVNGIMFSLLEKEELVKEAREQNLDKIIIRLIRTTDNENVKKQLDFIVQSRLFGRNDYSVGNTEQEPGEEVDLLEVELDQDDIATPSPCGEEFLEEYRLDVSANDSKKVQKDWPSSARTFNEETKQFYHKPSSERGIFEKTQPKTFNNPHGLIRHFIRNKTCNKNSSRWPNMPLCYMQNPQRLQNGQNRYSCGCYDAICREVAEDGRRLNLNEYESSSTVKNSDRNTDGGITRPENRKGGSGCAVCGDKVCDCAFEPRPRLCRTPMIS